MEKTEKTNPLLEKLIADLPDEPQKVRIVKTPSVREAIIDLRKYVGKKVFTKRQLIELIEAAFPELAPVEMSNLDASMNRAKDYLECVQQGERKIYRFKQVNTITDPLR